MTLLSVRSAVWLSVSVLTVATLSAAAWYFPTNYPEETLALESKVVEWMDRVTLPIKLARLSMQPPDIAIRMPVYGVKVGSVTDTWHGPRDGGARLHEGQDIFAAKNTPVFSGTSGYVRRIGDSSLGGLHVFVTGAGGRRYYYAHLNSVASGLRVGQWVTTDTVLGFVGNTGNAITTPPHLHFGMYEGREAVNPLPLLGER